MQARFVCVLNDIRITSPLRPVGKNELSVKNRPDGSAPRFGQWSLLHARAAAIGWPRGPISACEMANVIDLSLSSDEGSPSRAKTGVPSRLTGDSQPLSGYDADHDDPFNDLGDFDLPEVSRKRRRLHRSVSLDEIETIHDERLSSIPVSAQAHTALQNGREQPPIQQHRSSPKVESRYLEISASSDGSVVDGRSEPSSPLKRVAIDLSTKTTALLAEISSNATSRRVTEGAGQTRPGRISGKGKQESNRTTTTDGSGEFDAEQQKGPTKAEKAQAKEEEKVRRQLTRKAAAEEKKTQKEAEKARRQLAKEKKDKEKKKEKEDALELAVANRARWEKSISVTEMIVDLPASIDGKEAGTSIKDALKSCNIETTTYNSILPNIIRFRRKVASSFNKKLGYWEPAPEAVHVEKQVVCLISGQHLLSMATATGSEDEGLDAYVGMVRAKYPDFRVTCLVEGLDQVLKDARKASSKAYEASVRKQAQGPAAERGASAAQTIPTQRQLDPEEIKEKIDQALLELQVAHGYFIHQTEKPAETADFVATFTEQMSTIPYKSA